MNALYSRIETTPLGPLTLTGNADGALSAIWFDTPKHAAMLAAVGGWQRDDAAFSVAREQLGEYFAGTRREFSVPLAPSGTPFQQTVWLALRDIPYGRTVSYLDIAKSIGNARAVRAVGLANGRNPLAPIVPCHRVIGSSGALTGYAGGLDRKRWLLELEGFGTGKPTLAAAATADLFAPSTTESPQR